MFRPAALETDAGSDWAARDTIGAGVEPLLRAVFGSLYS